MPLSDREAAQILARWQTLMGEHEALRDALRERVQQPHWPGVGPCIGMLRREAATVKRLLAMRGADDSKDTAETEAVAAKLAASNLSAREAAWTTIKKCRGLLALDRRFPVAGADAAQRRGGGVRYSGGRTAGVFVNAVVDDGRAWLRIVTTTESQLRMEMVENGWEDGERIEEDDDESTEGNDHLDDYTICSAAVDLVQAARANRFRGAPPRLVLVLSRIGAGQAADVDALLRQWKRRVEAVARGDGTADAPAVTVTLYTATSPFYTASPPALDVALGRLMPAVAIPATLDDDTPLNMDTSILIALVSDMAHGAVAPQAWHPRQRQGEIRQEAAAPGQVLRRLLGDVLRGRRLVCTREAATAFRSMVEGMGQATERERASVLVGEEGEETDETDPTDQTDQTDQTPTTLTPSQRLARYRALSAYPDAIPDDLLLPITVVGHDWDTARIRRAVAEGDLPRAAADVLHQMTAVVPTAVPTLAVFFGGWAARQTTITTNLAARNRIDRLLEQYRTSVDEVGPSVWVCRTVRSLNGTRPKRR